MYVTNEFQKVWIFFTDNRFITILEKMPASPMTNVECYCISGHKAAHHGTKRRSTSTQQNMEVVRDQGPRITLGLGLLKDDGEAFKKGSAIFIVPKDFTTFDPPCHHVLKDTGSIKSGLAWHKNTG